MATFDEVLNVVIPTALILIVVGFVWVKFINPYVVPQIQKLIEYSQEHKQERVDRATKKEISFE